MASNMTDFYETWNLSLLSPKEHIKNMIKDPSPSQEHPRPPKLQQSVIILQEGSWHPQLNVEKWNFEHSFMIAK